jgi:hypothetical protein
MGKENENEQFLHDYGQPCLISYVLCSRLLGPEAGVSVCFSHILFRLVSADDVWLPPGRDQQSDREKMEPDRQTIDKYNSFPLCFDYHSVG